MAGELLFTVHPGQATRAATIDLADAGLKERADLQEWVRANPEIVGDDILIVTFEFDAWEGRRGREADRLDLLGLDPTGRLVVVELKRGIAPTTTEMQAIKYAAYASGFTPETLAEVHARYLTAVRGVAVPVEEAHAALEEHAGSELELDQLGEPRIVLIAAEFPQQVTASVAWLSKMGLDIVLMQFSAYQAEHDLVATVSRLWPLPEVEEFTISPRRAEIRAAEVRRSDRRETNAVVRLIADGVLDVGAQVILDPSGMPVEFREPVRAWITEEPARGQATWRHDPRAPLHWLVDGTDWSPTGLAREIARRATGRATGALAGPRVWQTVEGDTLATLAGTARGRARDWSQLHVALESLREGEWTTYGDLAALIGSAALPVGQHVANHGDCPNAYRVLTAQGTIAPGFTWTDPAREDDPLEALQAEGLEISPDGRADPASRVAAGEFASRIGD